jgi:Cu/Ag efflux protein CusF
MSQYSRRMIQTVVASMLTALVFEAGPVMAQMQQTAPSSGPEATPPRVTLTSVEGTVRKIYPAAGKVEVSSGLFGLFRTTLEVKPETRIQTEGRQASLTEIREGDKVKASYEVREGQTIAKSILVTPAQESPTPPAEQSPRAPGTIPSSTQ